jgi:hypothetical protein
MLCVCNHALFHNMIHKTTILVMHRYPIFAPNNLNMSSLVEGPTSSEILLKFAVSRNPQRCLQAVIVAIGFSPITRPVNATNTVTSLGNACLAGAAAGSFRNGTTVATAGQKVSSAEGESDDLVSIQNAEIKALYQETCVSGKYSVNVETPAQAGCYYFVLHLADASRQVMVLRATSGGN